MANISEYLNNILKAVFGKDVRQSIHDGIDAINKEVISNTTLTNNTKVRQDLLEQKYDNQIAELANEDPQLPEIVDARSGFDTLGEVLKQKIYHFNTVAEMKACENLIVGNIVQTEGYYEANDKGKATYKIVNDSTLVDDSGSIHDLQNGLKAILIRKDDFVNSRQFGAKGDGNTDDTAALQNLFNFTKVKNKIILQGTYNISEPLEVNYFQNIRGELKVNTSIVQTSSNSDYVINIRQSNVLVEDLIINCNDLSGGILVKDKETDNTRISASVKNCSIIKIGENKIGSLLDCACGYNYYDNIRFFNCDNNCTYMQLGDTYSGTYSGGELNINYVYISNCKFDMSNKDIQCDFIKINFGEYIFIDKCDLCNNADSNSYAINITGQKNCRMINITDTEFYNLCNAIRVSRPTASNLVGGIKVSNSHFLQHNENEGVFINVNDEDTSKITIYNLKMVNNIFNFIHNNKGFNITKCRKINFANNSYSSQNVVEYFNIFEHATLVGCTFNNNELLNNTVRIVATYDSNNSSYSIQLSDTHYYTYSIDNNILTVVFHCYDVFTYLTGRNSFLTLINTTGNTRINAISANESEGTITTKIILADSKSMDLRLGII